MSGTLMPSSGSSNFAQQGSVDWVALSNSSVQFSVAVLARLSKAGVDAYTLRFGQAICCSFALEPRAQELVTEAIRTVKKYPSYGDLMWFGFGIKDIVTDLADTEEGLTLVALCAALSTTYDSLFSAQVIRELCVLCKAPQSFTPALRQWKTMVELCAGILSSSHFVTLANGFRRLICGHLRLPLDTRHTPTIPIALAEAILTLARISKRSLVNATISGALNCAWLAAFAESILSLDVGICDTNGDFLYRSRQCAEAHPQLTILLCPANTARGGEVLLKSKASVIPQGHSLLLKETALHSAHLTNWQSPLSTILHDVFGESVDRLLEIQLSINDDAQVTAFALYLRCMSLLQRQDSRGLYLNVTEAALNISLENHPVNPLIWTHPNSSGPRLLSFATKRLPELPARLFDTLPVLCEELPDTLKLGRSALKVIEGNCQCGQHQHDPGEWDASNYDAICLLALAETIVIFLWILIDCDIDDDVLPSVTGLTNLYTWQANKDARPIRNQFYAFNMKRDYPVLGIDLVFHVLSGVSVSGNSPSYSSLSTMDQLARVGNGICVYYNAIEDPRLPLDNIFRLRVVRGYISYSGFRYKDLCGFSCVYGPDSIGLSDIQADKPILTVKTVIQETSDDTRLEMAYLLDYVDQTSSRRSCWLHLPRLFRELQRTARGVICPNGCDRVYEPDKYRTMSTLPGLRSLPRLEDDCVDKARQLLKSLRPSKNTWLLYSEPGFINIIIGQPLLLYAVVNPSSLCLAPFTDCFKCIIHRFSLLKLKWYWSERGQKQLAMLVTPDKASVVFLRPKVSDSDHDSDLVEDTSSNSGSPMEV